MIGNSVVSLREDKKGNIWIGIYEKGLSIFDGKNLVISQLNRDWQITPFGRFMRKPME
jgi:ligand-binding sensor domain-containing protein